MWTGGLKEKFLRVQNGVEDEAGDWNSTDSLRLIHVSSNLLSGLSGSVGEQLVLKCVQLLLIISLG